MRHLAEINVARLKHDADDPRVAPFMNALDTVNGIAERIDGFVWRHVDDSGNATETRINDDPRLIVNVSVWQGVAPLEQFVWNTVHRQFYKRRAEWFSIMESMHFAMWWVPAGTRPTPAEAATRLDHYNQHGNTETAFGWSHLPEATLWNTNQCSPIAAE